MPGRTSRMPARQSSESRPLGSSEAGSSPARQVTIEDLSTRPWHVRMRLGSDGLAPFHAASPWTLGAGILGALAVQGLEITPAWVGFCAGYLAMGAVAAWALADPIGGPAIDD